MHHLFPSYINAHNAIADVSQVAGVVFSGTSSVVAVSSVLTAYNYARGHFPRRLTFAIGVVATATVGGFGGAAVSEAGRAYQTVQNFVPAGIQPARLTGTFSRNTVSLNTPVVPLRTTPHSVDED